MRYKYDKLNLLYSLNLEHEKIKKNKILIKFSIILSTSLILSIILFKSIIGVGRVDGDSMYPTLKDNDIIVFNRLHKDKVDINDIIICALDNSNLIIKRVIAKYGDTVDIINNKISINGNLLNSIDFDVNAYSDLEFPITLKKDELFIIGDNFSNSIDSRVFGCININSIKGTLIYLFRRT